MLEEAHLILIYTDHKKIEYLRFAKCPTQCQVRWALFFSRFDFHLTCILGSRDRKPNFLSEMFPYDPAPVSPYTIQAEKNFLMFQHNLMAQIKLMSKTYPVITKQFPSGHLYETR